MALTNNLTKAASGESVQIGGSFATADATASPKTSPLSYTNAVTTITVPVNAVEFIVNPSTDMRISELVGMAQYDVVIGGSKESVPCSKMSSIYITRDSVSGTLNFRFTVI